MAQEIRSTGVAGFIEIKLEGQSIRVPAIAGFIEMKLEGQAIRIPGISAMIEIQVAEPESSGTVFGPLLQDGA